MVYTAVDVINLQAQANEQSDKESIAQMFAGASIDIDPRLLIEKLLYNCDVTINFHPDRFSNNGKLIVDNLLADGEYCNQYKTGTSNGGRTAYAGGDRDLWEKRLFCGAYHDGKSGMTERPKYGALNIHNYLDGASARFGSCFFTLKPHVVSRCTFAFGDSSTEPEVMGTVGHFYGILRALLESVRDTGRLLSKGGFSVKQAVDYILAMRKDQPRAVGGNMDDCIETHIHGTISLSDDVGGLYIDESFIGTDVGGSAKKLAERYGINLRYIPRRQYPVSKIGGEWKGPLARPLAERIDQRFSGGGMLTAALIGLGSQDSVLHQSDWLDIGNEYELFQNFKYLWHYLACFGHRRRNSQ